MRVTQTPRRTHRVSYSVSIFFFSKNCSPFDSDGGGLDALYAPPPRDADLVSRQCGVLRELAATPTVWLVQHAASQHAVFRILERRLRMGVDELSGRGYEWREFWRAT